jgi:hypothetical protein
MVTHHARPAEVITDAAGMAIKATVEARAMASDARTLVAVTNNRLATDRVVTDAMAITASVVTMLVKATYPVQRLILQLHHYLV